MKSDLKAMMITIMMIIMVAASSSSTGEDHGVVIATGVAPILDGVVAHGADQEVPGVEAQEVPGEEDLEEDQEAAALEVAAVDVEDVETDTDIYL